MWESSSDSESGSESEEDVLAPQVEGTGRQCDSFAGIGVLSTRLAAQPRAPPRVTSDEAEEAPYNAGEEVGRASGCGVRAGAVEVDSDGVLKDMHLAQRLHLALGIVEMHHGNPSTVRVDHHQVDRVLRNVVLLVYKRYRVISNTGRQFMINNAKPSTNVCSWSTPLLHELTGTFTGTEVRALQNTRVVF